MKKFALYGLMALSAAAFTACDDYEEPNPPAQSNAQESILKVDDIQVNSVIADEQYDLTQYNTEGKSIELIQVVTDKLPDTYDLVSHLEISAKDAGRWNEVTSTVERDAENPSLYHVFVTPDDLQGIYSANISKAPSAKAIDVRLSLATSIANNTLKQEALIGGPGHYFGPWVMTVLPIPSDVKIEDAYYLLGTINGWDVATAVKLEHTGDNPYDNPVFSIKVNISEEEATSGWWWKLIPASTYEAGSWQDDDYSQWGPAENGDESLEGMIVPKLNGEDPGAGCLKVYGEYLLTFNMIEGTYAVSEAVSYLYTPGGSNGWNHGNSQMLYTTNYVNYLGFVAIDGEFKLTSSPDWAGKYNLGAGAADGLLANGSNDNLKVAENGLYWANVNLPALTYVLTRINTLGLIGDATPNGWDASTALTPSADGLTWTGTVKLGDGTFKIRANDAWDIDFGGSAEDLEFKGANIPSPGAGTYEVTLNLAQLPYSMQLVKK